MTRDMPGCNSEDLPLAVELHDVVDNRFHIYTLSFIILLTRDDDCGVA